MSLGPEPEDHPSTRKTRVLGTPVSAPSIVAGGCVRTFPPSVLSELLGAWQSSGAEKFGMSQQEFLGVLAEVGGKYLPADATEAEAARFYSGLKHEELALARACAAGNEQAWEVFLTRYRGKLYQSANTIAPNETLGRELADSLYAELYGMKQRDGRRVSKLEFYSGRGSLEGWLRTVLAQQYIDRYRGEKRLVSLDEEADSGTQFQAPPAGNSPGVDERLEPATDAALGALGDEDRLLLAWYFLDRRTLAEIARLLQVHESTISRRLEKTVRRTREKIIQELRGRGMSRRQAGEALETDVRDLAVDIRSRLAQAAPNRPFSPTEGGK